MDRKLQLLRHLRAVKTRGLSDSECKHDRWARDVSGVLHRQDTLAFPVGSLELLILTLDQNTPPLCQRRVAWGHYHAL